MLEYEVFKDIFDERIFPHIGNKPDDRYAKLLNTGYNINKLLQVQKIYELNLENIVEKNKELNNQLFQKLQILEESLQNLLIS